MSEIEIELKREAQSSADADAADLKKLGYAQELLREMGGFSTFAISFSVISIVTGAIQLYGYGLQHGGPFQLSVGWLFVSLFTMFVALSMAELASAYPTAGALYHWSSFLGGRALGWFTACFNTVGQFAILAGIDYGLAQLMVGLFNWPATPGTVSALYAALLFSHAILNHFGIRIVSWLNDFSAWYHIGVVALIVGLLAAKGFPQPVQFLLTKHNTDGFPFRYSFLIGLLLAQWTLTGYDASAHVTEETINPRKNAPWGIFLAVVVSVIVGFVMLSVVTLSIPDLKQADGFGDNAFTEILKLRLGTGTGTLVGGLALGAMWLCGLATMTSASRMVYAFARDGGLPFWKIWSRVSKKHKTPSPAIWALACVALVLAFSVKLYSAVVSIATIALYISYGLPIVARLYARARGKDQTIGPWNLGKFSVIVAVIAILWILFISTVFVLPPNEQAGSVICGAFFLMLVLWFSLARKRFKGPKIPETLGNS
jgi:amino acid transporter